jgi:hypothetical protein
MQTTLDVAQTKERLAKARLDEGSAAITPHLALFYAGNPYGMAAHGGAE